MSRWPHENDYDGIIAIESARTGVSMPLIKAIISLESEFLATATRAEAARASLPPTPDFPQGGDMSIGLMQLLVRTARTLGYTGDVGAKAGLTGLFDPSTNVHLGTLLLRDNVNEAARRGLGVDAAISAYNGGWRPSLGFGGLLPNGQFANEAYVKVVFERLAYFGASADEMSVTPGRAAVSSAVASAPAAVPTVDLPPELAALLAPDPSSVSVIGGDNTTVQLQPLGAGDDGGAGSALALIGAALGVLWLVMRVVER